MRAWFGVIVAGAACGGGEAQKDLVTFHADIRPVVERNCATCHRPDGVGPTDFTDATDWETGAPAWAAAAAAAVQSGAMPPWQASDACHPIEASLAITDAERAAFAAWADAEFPLGDPATYVPPEVPERPMASRKEAWGLPDLSLAAERPYQIQTAQPDDYRCIVLDQTFETDTWVRGLEVSPDQKPYVHHLIVYQFAPDQVPELEALDAADPELGYACFNNPDAETLQGWAPGQNGEFLPDGLARYVPAGAKWVVQIHYNTLGRDPATVPADQTRVDIWLADAAPAQAVVTIPFPDFGIRLPAGDPDVTEKESFDLSWLPSEVPIAGVMGHMHQLGTSIKLEAKQADGKACLLDVPDWDFNWQQTYYFPEDQWFMAGPGTELVMTCSYDNSASNQIVVNGEALEPRDVGWGENTTDEMCLTYIMAVLPTAWLGFL